MTGAKFDIEKFDGTGDFRLWRIKMRALLIQHGCEAALEVLPADMEAQTKVELNKKAHSAVILCLGNKVLREVTGETTAAGVWSKLETLYMTKSLANKLYLNKKLYKPLKGGLVTKGVVVITLKCVRSQVQFLLGKLDFCENYVLGKSHRVSFGVRRHTTQGVIDYVHSDLWSLSKVESLGGKRFKHEAFGKFKEWKQLVENQTGRTVKKLRTDNGLKFCNREFEQLCIESGIARHLTVAGMLQQNGLAERMNITLMDKIRCLLIRSGLPNTFSAEATCMAAYLINRSPSTEIEKKTPIEMWSGHPSDYGMLRIFGYVAYSHVKQGKLEPRAVKCVLLGYPEGVKGYRLYRLDDESPKIVISRNVVFNESVMYKDTLKDSGACADKSVEELQVKVELQTLNNRTLEEDETNQEDQTDQEYGDDEDAGDQETDQTPDLTDYQLVQDREPRTRTKPLSSKWKVVIKEEMDSLRKNKTWELVDHPAGQKLVSCKWLFKIKEGIEGVQKPRYKARLVACGFTQRQLEQLDVKTAFLHGNLEEVIYMRQPSGYEQGNNVCLLKKYLYGLKQSPRQWYRRFDEYMMSNGFKRSSYDSCVYYRSYASGEYIYLLLYVDDMLIACKSKAEIGSTKSLLNKEFDMKELGIDNGNSVKMPLGGHCKLSLKDCPVRDCDVERMSKVPYANAVGSLMYLMVCTRPDIAYAVSVVSIYLANPGKNRWEAVKWILKYLRGTANVGLVYATNHGNHVDVKCFVDSDYAKDPDKGRSMTGYAFLVHGCVVSWKATLQHVVVLSTTEAKYMALTEAVKEAI
ncbi:retrotransposon protein, putative, ty1-copia subclass [Tanacetum coccineum]